MGRKASVPTYRLHKPSGRAVTFINRQTVYLGKHGSPESIEKFNRLVAEFPTPESRLLVVGKGQPIAVATLVAKYLAWAESEYYGKGSENLNTIQSAVRPLLLLYASEAAERISPLCLKAVRQNLIDTGCRYGNATKQKKQGRQPAKAPKEKLQPFRPLRRNYVNKLVQVIVRIFRWGVENELVPVQVADALRMVEGLRKGRCKGVIESRKIKPVPIEDVEAILPVVAPEIQTMVQVQRLGVMRPDEITIMRSCDIDMSQDVWIYRPSKYKTDYLDSEPSREISLGPKAQALLQPWIDQCKTSDEYLFSPRKVLARLDARRSDKSEAKKRRRRKGNAHYDDASYRRAVTRACEEVGVPRWTPNQLRHGGATDVRKLFGLEGAQAAAGHKHAKVTEIYAEGRRDLAGEIARKLG